MPGWLLLLEVMPVAATDHGSGFIADREPGLGPLSGIKVDRSPLTAQALSS